MFRVREGGESLLRLENMTQNVFRVIQIGFEEFSEYLGANSDILFFRGDPFGEPVIEFKRLFNNERGISFSDRVDRYY